MPSRTEHSPFGGFGGERERGKMAASEVLLSDLVPFGDRLLPRGGTELVLGPRRWKGYDCSMAMALSRPYDIAL